MKLSKLTQPRPTETSTDVLGDPITIVYDRARIDTTFWEMQLWRQQLAHVLISWDVTDDKTDKPYAPAENANGSRPAEWLKLFGQVPDFALRAVLDAILDDNRAGPKVNAGSSDS